MHMADVLVSPLVGGAMWAASLGLGSFSIKKVQKSFEEKIELNENKIPLMGVMGAFIFAAQMINFTIPGTGSSGHLGGGMILAVILGPYAGFLTLFCILAIQALFFADGGLLALGCNVFNMGFYTCFVAYPLIYKNIIKKGMSKKVIFIGCLISAIIGLQLGAFSVVLETLLSGKTELPFKIFLLFMQPIHLAIGFVEGLITTAVISFVWNARPEILEPVITSNKVSYKKVITVLLCIAVLTGGFISHFASSNPDGLEWSINKTLSSNELNEESKIHELLGNIQNHTAFLPDYKLINNSTDQNEAKTQIEAGNSVSGIIGSLVTLVIAVLIGTILNIYKKSKKNAKQN